jgi:alpha-glucosidase
VLSNHDVSRHASRYDDPVHGESRARLAALLLLALRGTPFVYYGEEIGMRSVEIPEERLQDPLARTLHPKLSRDPARTPMQWEPGAGAGFTSVEPWLPVGPDAKWRNVEAQRADPTSLLWLYRDLIDLRRRTAALRAGDYRTLPAPPEVLAFERRAPGSLARVALNFASEPRVVELGAGTVSDGLSTRAGRELPGVAGRVELAPCEGLALVLR